MFEEPVRRAACGDGLAPCQYGQSGSGMKREGEQIEDHQHGSQCFAAVPEIVLEV
jgi:hypothetical protein